MCGTLLYLDKERALRRGDVSGDDRLEVEERGRRPHRFQFAGCPHYRTKRDASRSTGA